MVFIYSEGLQLFWGWVPPSSQEKYFLKKSPSKLNFLPFLLKTIMENGEPGQLTLPISLVPLVIT